MSQIRMDSEDTAEIRDALQAIQWKAESIPASTFMQEIITQVKRIGGLLPQVKFEGGKQCQQ